MSDETTTMEANTTTTEPAEAATPQEEIVPLRELELRAMARALRVTSGNVTEAARRLGMGRATLYRRVRDEGGVLVLLARYAA